MAHLAADNDGRETDRESACVWVSEGESQRENLAADDDGPVWKLLLEEV